MSWQDQYRPGSFRGVPFVTVDHRGTAGRRGETNEYPYRDDPYRDDLGRGVRRWRLQAFVIGADYMAARDALIAALEAPGPGTLVHPFLGTFQASVDGDIEFSESTREGGMARFDLAFVEPGQLIAASQATDTSTLAIASADTTDAAAEQRFADAFSIASEPPHVQAAAAALAKAFAAVTLGVGAALGGAGVVLRTFYAGIAALQGAEALLIAPLRLADTVLAMVSGLADLRGTPYARASALLGLIDWAQTLPALGTATPSRATIAANQQAFADLVAIAAAGALARVAAGAAFTSYDEAIGFRDQLANSLDDVAFAAADRFNDALAADLDTLRRAIIADITARGGSLERLFSYTPPAVAPALVIAWRLYRDPAACLDQAAAIVARNRIAHPGFVPAAPLQVLTAGSADG